MEIYFQTNSLEMFQDLEKVQDFQEVQTLNRIRVSESRYCWRVTGSIEITSPSWFNNGWRFSAIGRLKRRLEWKVRGTRGAESVLLERFQTRRLRQVMDRSKIQLRPRESEARRFPGNACRSNQTHARVFEFRFTFQPRG